VVCVLFIILFLRLAALATQLTHPKHLWIVIDQKPQTLSALSPQYENYWMGYFLWWNLSGLSPHSLQWAWKLSFSDGLPPAVDPHPQTRGNIHSARGYVAILIRFCWSQSLPKMICFVGWSETASGSPRKWKTPARISASTFTLAAGGSNQGTRTLLRLQTSKSHHHRFLSLSEVNGDSLVTLSLRVRSSPSSGLC